MPLSRGKLAGQTILRLQTVLDSIPLNREARDEVMGNLRKKLSLETIRVLAHFIASLEIKEVISQEKTALKLHNLARIVEHKRRSNLRAFCFK